MNSKAVCVDDIYDDERSNTQKISRMLMPDKFFIGVADDYFKIFFEPSVEPCLKLTDCREAYSFPFVATSPHEVLAIYDNSLHVYEVDEQDDAKFILKAPSLRCTAVYALAYMEKNNFAIFHSTGLSIFNSETMSLQQIRKSKKKNLFGSSKKKSWKWGIIRYALYVRGFLFCTSSVGLLKIDTGDWSFVKNENIKHDPFDPCYSITYISDKDVFAVSTRYCYIAIIDFNLASAEGNGIIRRKLDAVVYRPLTKDMVAISNYVGYTVDYRVDSYGTVYTISTTNWQPTKQLRVSCAKSVCVSDTHIVIGSVCCFYLLDHELRIIQKFVHPNLYPERPFGSFYAFQQCFIGIYDACYKS